MAWRFRKQKNLGLFRFTASKKGIGKSIDFLGFRIGVSPNGKKFWSFGIKGTGLYWIKYYK